jgi:xanthine dehydrogenase large subunit
VNQIKARLSALAKKHFDGAKFDPVLEIELPDPAMDPDLLFRNGQVIQVSSKKSVPLPELVQLAYQNRISLGAYAHHKTEGLGFDKTKITGKAFAYFTQGMAVTEVSLDEYTGEVKVLRADLLMDLGRSINPGIDRGQVTGAFVQGMGWVTTEHLVYDEGHRLVSHSPTTYKIPSVQDTHRDFRVDFIENDGNPGNVHGSKAVGEPPFLLGSSVWTAIKHALSCRAMPGVPVALSSPATGERILEALERQKGRS